MFLPHCLSNYEGRLACIADLQAESMQMDKIIVIKGLGADYVSPSLPVHIDPYE